MLFLPLLIASANCASDWLWTCAEWRSGIFMLLPTAVSPLPSAPWHIAQLDLNVVSSTSSADAASTVAIVVDVSMARATKTGAMSARAKSGIWVFPGITAPFAALSFSHTKVFFLAIFILLCSCYLLRSVLISDELGVFCRQLPDAFAGGGVDGVAKCRNER